VNFLPNCELLPLVTYYRNYRYQFTHRPIIFLNIEGEDIIFFLHLIIRRRNAILTFSKKKQTTGVHVTMFTSVKTLFHHAYTKHTSYFNNIQLLLVKSTFYRPSLEKYDQSVWVLAYVINSILLFLLFALFFI
ncbi:hypothetical protein L9F63_022491, partial [Diploptera punctata]